MLQIIVASMVTGCVVFLVVPRMIVERGRRAIVLGAESSAEDSTAGADAAENLAQPIRLKPPARRYLSRSSLASHSS